MNDNRHPPVDDGLNVIDGIVQRFTSDEEVPGRAEVGDTLASHAQGIARYGRLRYVTHSDKKSAAGVLIVVRDKQIITQIHLPPRTLDNQALNHAGGIQRIGRFLVMPLEPMADAAVSLLTFWDLGNPEAPCEIEALAIPSNTRKAGSAGIANVGSGTAERWYVAACDNGHITVYSSPAFPAKPFTLAFEDSLRHSYESVCLVGDRLNKLYALAFRREHAIVGRDLIDVFTIDVQKGKLNPIKRLHQITSGTLKGDVHFRWGAGIDIEDDGQITVLATKRNFDSLFLTTAERAMLEARGADLAVLDRRFHINLFSH